MEVHGRQPGDLRSVHDRFEEQQDRLRNANRERVRQARQLLAHLSLERRERAKDSREVSQPRDSERVEPERGRETRPASREAQATRDVIEISDAGRAHGAAEEERAERVEVLRQAFQKGSLNSDERVERAAQGLLQG